MGGRASGAAVYPTQLCRAICRGLRRQKRLGAQGKREYYLNLCDQGDQQAVAFDDVSGASLDPVMVQAARREEMRFVREQQVWTPIAVQTARERGWTVIGTKWIDIDKGDAERPNYRSRLVAQEYNTSIGRDPYGENFSATPPIEALRGLLSVAATYRADGHRSVVVIADTVGKLQ